jgi:hypothetical protein
MWEYISYYFNQNTEYVSTKLLAPIFNNVFLILLSLVSKDPTFGLTYLNALSDLPNL